MDYDFMVGFTIFYATGYKTMFRHFNKLETAELFASNINLKNNCKIYVDYLYYKKLEDKIKAKIEDYDDKGMTVNLVDRSAGKTFQQAVHYEVKKVLQSLLEKEQ